TIRRFHTEHGHRLKVDARVAGRLDPPRLQVVLDVRGRQPQAARVDGPALQLIRRDIGEPFLEILSTNRPQAAAGRHERARPEYDEDRPEAKRDATAGHDSPCTSMNALL